MGVSGGRVGSEAIPSYSPNRESRKASLGAPRGPGPVPVGRSARLPLAPAEG
jgi:hypothetical protein